MGAFIYRCPTTGLNVQGWVADDPSAENENTYEAVVCMACTKIHLVNPKSGKTAGDGAD
jgi:hypothetical protein